MTTTWRGAALGAVATAAVALAVGACGDARKSPSGSGQTATNEAVVAPYGFKIEITGASIPADPTATATPPTVTFSVSDANGAPIQALKDELGKAPNGSTPASGYPYTNAPRFTLARLDGDAGYHSLYLNQANNQAVSVTLPRDPGQFDERVTSNGNGSYTFKLDPLSANPSDDERGRTYTAGVWASRRPSQDVGEDQAASSTFSFVPAGGGAQTTRQVVTLDACNRCHGPAVRAHGTRLGVQLCQTCHTSQTIDTDTGASVELVELIHKIHYGGDRPGPVYTIIGFQGAVHTFDAPWMNDVRDCGLCHQGANADRHLTQPSLRACTTCHSIVKFDNSAPAACTIDKKDTALCDHPGGPITTNCTLCHAPQEIQGRHPSIFTIAQDWKYELQSADVGADRKPTVRFAVRNAQNQPIDLATDPSYKEPASSLNVQLGWPPKDYTNAGASTAAPGQPRSIAIVRGGTFNPAGSNVTAVNGQTGVYEVTSPVALPQDVTSFTVFMDGHPVARGENIPVVNAVQSFSATTGGAADARRQVVSVDGCNQCHGVVSAHGRNRNGSIETCVVCHNPHATDWQKRQGTADAGSEAPIDFKYLIHGVHSADIRSEPLIIYGFNGANAATGGAPGTPNEFPGEIPHGAANCTMCHTGVTYVPPLPADAQDTTIDTNDTPADPSDDTQLGKTEAVCTSCHDQVRFTQEAPALPGCSSITPRNSQACFHTGGTATEANCASCHGRGGAADVTTVHHVQH